MSGQQHHQKYCTSLNLNIMERNSLCNYNFLSTRYQILYQRSILCVITTKIRSKGVTRADICEYTGIGPEDNGLVTLEEGDNICGEELRWKGATRVLCALLSDPERVPRKPCTPFLSRSM